SVSPEEALVASFGACALQAGTSGSERLASIHSNMFRRMLIAFPPRGCARKSVARSLENLTFPPVRKPSPSSNVQNRPVRRTTMPHILQDVRFGLRMLFRRRGLTFVAILALALGIGANTAIFSVVNTVLMRPLPFPAPNELVWFWESQPHLS